MSRARLAPVLLLALLLSACGGSSCVNCKDDEPAQHLPPVDCQAKPELCK